ncbi:MAG: acyltransferase [Cyanobacteria bacterium SBLK]|nr:acyltransferase [Cyanobacteria bacterium SBLK]
MAVRHIQKLDSLRGFAALYVLVYHCADSADFIPKILKIGFFSFGQEAVMMFFLLSGFVIHMSCSQKDVLDVRNYLIRRFRRIYFPFFISLFVSTFIFLFNNKLIKNFSWFELVGNCLMLQDISFLKPGTWVEPFLGNVVLWSLSYEWWFYILFIIAFKTIFKNKKRLYIILGISVFSLCFYWIHPNQIFLFLSYFIIWWCGVEISEVFLKYNRLPLAKVKPVLISIYSMCFLTAIPVFLSEKIELGIYPFLTFRHFFIVSFLLTIMIVWHRYKMKFFDNIFGIFTIFGSISYTIYLFHYPILLQWQLSDYIANIWIVYFIKIALLLSLCYLVDIKLQPIVNRYLK